MTADYAHKFARVTISGSCFSGSEQWSTGFQYGWEDADLDDIVPGVAEEIGTKWQTFFQTAANEFSDVYRSEEVKVALINTNGKTDVENIDYYPFPGTVMGGRAAQVLPPQITIVATLTSDFQRGLASKGRMYLPGMCKMIEGATGRLPAAFTETLNTNFKSFLDSINADTDVPGEIIIASKGHKTNALDVDGQPVYENGRNAFVTGCRIGNVYDTQRRRRNDLAEAYNTKVLA